MQTHVILNKTSHFLNLEPPSKWPGQPNQNSMDKIYKTGWQGNPWILKYKQGLVKSPTVDSHGISMYAEENRKAEMIGQLKDLMTGKLKTMQEFRKVTWE